MGFWELFIIAVGVSMDAFAIAICKGLSVEKLEKKHMITIGLWSGGAQALMPLLGYFLGSSFHSFVDSIDHWVSFALLLIIGINMIKESREKTKKLDSSFSVKSMALLALADSIDAMAVGVTFAFHKVRIIPSVLLIGITTFILSVIGIKIGNKFGAKYKSKAELAGGIVLTVMGTLILLEDLGVLKGVTI